jgi:SulP family sulfate permease
MPPSFSTRLHRFRPRLADTLRGYSRPALLADIGAGLTVGVVALPLAMAFAIASGVKPEQGLFTAIIAGLLISALGGSHVQIGGPAGAFIVIVYGIVERYGLTNLLISTAMAGVLLLLMGLFRLGVLVRYVPVAIVIGFTNGIAVLIGLSQVKDFFGLSTPKLPGDFFAQVAVLAAQAHTVNPWAVLIACASLATVVFWPKSYAMPVDAAGLASRLRRWSAHLPGTIVALALATLAVSLFGLPVETIGTRFGGIPQGLPVLALPPFSWATAKLLLIPTLTIALLGAVESLLCARVADNLTPYPRHDPNQELMAQGVANIISPLFGGIPATGTIARTVTNIRAGARSPVAGIVHALCVLLVVLVAAPLATNVPLAALAGILAFVAWNMGEWREFARLRRFSLQYRTILVGTFLLTVIFDLTVAVEVGLVLACAFFIYRMSTLFRVQALSGPAGVDGPAGAGAPAPPPGVHVLELFGALFFGAVGKIEQIPAQVPAGTRVLVLDMHRLVAMDTSGLDALEQLQRTLERQGQRLLVAAANEQPLSLMRRSGFARRLGEDRIVPTVAAACEAAAAVSLPG